MSWIKPVDFKTNSSFDPWTQSFTIYYPNGVTPQVANMANIFLVQGSAVSQAITQGIQIGASIILLIVLMLVTRKEKLLSMVFMVNALALLFVTIRGIIFLCVITGPLYNFYRYTLSYYNDMGNAKANSAAGEVITCLLTILVQLSLVLQVQIVCCNLEDWKRRGIMALSGLSAFTASAVRSALMVLNIHWNILNVERESQRTFNTLGKVASASNITFVISIGISAIIFSGKLWFAIRNRRALGIKQFGAMQIIFVMGCQTMLTPFIFTIIIYWAQPNGQVASFVPVAVAISLPLSAMWAAVNTSHAHIATPHSDKPGAIPVGNPNLDTERSDSCKDGTLLTSSTLVDDGSPGGLSSRRGWTKGRSSGKSDGGDIEMGRLTDEHDLGGVQVDRTYTVLSD